MTVVKAVRALVSAQWLSSRALVLHLRLLQKQSYSDNPSLLQEATDMFAGAEGALGSVAGKPPALTPPAQCPAGEKEGVVPENSHLPALLLLESGLAQHFFDRGDKGKALFQRALGSLGMQVQLTAALGRRTKHQVHDHAQLLLLARSSLLLNGSQQVNLSSRLHEATAALEQSFGGNYNSKQEGQEEVSMSGGWQHGEWELGTRLVTTVDEAGGEVAAIRDVQLDSADGGAAENILLEEGVKFSEAQGAVDVDERHNVLHPLEQAVLLALCLDVGNSNPSGDELTTEEMFPYLQAVLNMYHNHQHLLECSDKVRRKNDMLRFHSMGREVVTSDFCYEGRDVGRNLDWMVYSTTLLER